MVPKSLLDRLGFMRDMARRVQQARRYFSDKVQAARDTIYRLGYGLKSTLVENLLKDYSGVPTEVSFDIKTVVSTANRNICLERFWKKNAKPAWVRV